jgi:hypothetical protein
MRGHIKKSDILDLYERLSYLDKFEAVAAVINETLPLEEDLSDADYYFTVYSIWKIIEDAGK